MEKKISKKEYEISEMLKNKSDEDYSKLMYEEYRVLEFKYGFSDGEIRTLDEVGEILGMTRERVHQIEEKALRKLKLYFNEN